MNQASLRLPLESEELSPAQRRQINQLLRKAAGHYDTSCDVDVSNDNSASKRAKAKALGKKILHLDSSNSAALNLLGRIALDENQLTEAGRLINQACSLNPRSAGHQYSRGHVHLAKGQFTKAEQAFQLAIRLDKHATRAPSSLAYTHVMQGKIVEAFAEYRKLVKYDPEDQHIRSKLFECIANIQADYYSKELEIDVLFYLSFEDVNYNELAQITASLLIHKYGLGQAAQEQTVDILALANDSLFNQAMRKLYFTNASIEQLIIALRRSLLIESLLNSKISTQLLELTVNISLYSVNNEYVYPIDKQEREMIEALKELVQASTQQENWKPKDIAGALIMLAMYLPLHTLHQAEALLSFEKDQWPDFSHEILQRTLIDVFDEIQRAEKIPSLSPITNPVSKAVQAQYEQHPYPRWLSLNFHTSTPYGQALQRELKYFTPPQFFNAGELQILIAGCGTGKHALQVANYFRNVSVLAIDISRRSLAYSKKMAQKYAIHNIEFLHADILNLAQLNRRFHIIECSGVLHHMEDPAAGLAVLADLLVPQGVIKIGLYSEVARQSVVQCREIIQKQKLHADDHTVRLFRQAILQGQLGKQISSLKNSADFYNMSGCRDLLFHVQEHRFTALQLEQTCQDLKLDFLGFIRLPGTVQDQYRKCFPADKKMSNLAHWHKFEQQHPDTFGRMYQFYCQVKGLAENTKKDKTITYLP